MNRYPTTPTRALNLSQRIRLYTKCHDCLVMLRTTMSSPARVCGDDKVYVGGVLDGILQDGMNGYPVFRRQFTYPLDDPQVVSAWVLKMRTKNTEQSRLVVAKIVRGDTFVTAMFRLVPKA